MAIKALALICAIVGMVFSMIVSYHIVVAVLPDYLAYWWVGLGGSCAGVVLKVISAIED